MVDDILKSKKDTPLKLLCLEMLFRCSLFILKEAIKVQKATSSSFFWGGRGGNGKKVGQSDDAKRRKKGNGLMLKKLFLL